MAAKIQLYAGPARCGKTQRLFDRYREVLRGQVGGALAQCCWLAPNQTAVTQLQDSLLENSTSGFLQPNIFTFSGYAQSLITRSSRQIRPLSQPQKRRLLQHVIRLAAEAGELVHFAQVSATPGFVTQVDEFITNLKQADIRTEDFARWAQQRPASDQRIRELANLYSAYQQQLRNGELYDAEGRFWAARAILSDSNSIRQPYDLVVVNGFNDFTASQYDILRLLGENSVEMLLSLTVEQLAVGTEEVGSLLFAKTSHTLTRLRTALPQLEIEYLASPPPEEHTLEQLQHQLFREDEPEEGSGPEIAEVEILAAHSVFGEVEAVAERIKALLQAGKAAPEEIVVVCRGGETTVSVLSSVFPDFGIPFFVEQRPRLDAEPLVRSLLSLLRLHQDDWPFQALLEVINNRQFTRFDAGVESDTSFSLQPRVAVEHSIRSAQLPAGKAALIEQLEFRQSAFAEGKGEIGRRGLVLTIALAELRQLEEMLTALPTEATIDVWLQALASLLKQLGVLSSSFQEHSRAASAWALLRRSLGEIERVDDWAMAEESVLSLPEIISLIASVAREQRVPARSDSTGRVRVLSAESARKLSSKYLFLTGLSEQAFSSKPVETAAAEPGRDGQTAEVNLPAELAEQAEPSLARGDSMLLLYELVTRPSVGLTLSYPALDAKGQPLPASPLLTDLERSVGVDRIRRTTLSLGKRDGQITPPHSFGAFRRQAVDTAIAGRQEWLSGMISHPSFVRVGSSILAGIDCIAERGVREVFGPYEGLLLSESARAALAQRFSAEHLWSPSRLEGYAACPFRFFSEQLLGLEPLGELLLSNDARRRGSLLHDVLATIHEQLTNAADSDAYDLDETELIEKFLTTLDEAVKANPLRGIAQSLREIERREIEAWAPNYAEQETSYRKAWGHLDEPPRPRHFEVRFGPETHSSAEQPTDPASTTVPFELDLGDERIHLTGAIDRVDVGRAGSTVVFNIIDYKSGKGVQLKLDKVRSGHQLQLPLYALAAEQLLLAEEGAVALATGYWNIQGNGFTTKRGGSLQIRELADKSLRTSSDWKSLQPEIMQRVQELIQGIRAGEFPVYNQDEQCTRGCSMSTVCRVAQIRSLEKAWPPPEVTPEERTSGEEPAVGGADDN